MSSYKDLCLNVDLIPSELRIFCGGEVSSEFKGAATHYYFTKDDKACLILVYKKNTGAVTLQAGGKNPEISDQAINYIIEKMVTGRDKTFNLALKNYSSEKLTNILEYLQEECGVVVENKQIARDDAVSYKATGKQGDELSFTLYNTGTLQVQGRPLYVAMEVLSYLASVGSITQKEVIACASDVFSTKTSLDEVSQELVKKYPSAVAFAGTNMKALLLTAISMRGIPIAVEDYSVITFPALKALETLMRQSAVAACGEDWAKLGEKFDCQGGSKYILKEDVRKKVACDVTCALLTECYPHYRAHRNGTFHAKGIDGTTRVIRDRVEATRLLDTTMDMIERNCKALLEK